MGQKWNTVVQQTALQVDDVTNNPLFPAGGLNKKACQKRLDKWLDWYKNKVNQVPFNSGGDNEDPPSELEQVIADIASTKNDFDTGVARTRQNTAAAQAQNRANALAIQQASLGNYSTPAASDGRGSNRRGNNSGDSNGASATSRNASTITDKSNQMASVLEKHLEMGKERDAAIKLQMENETKRIRERGKVS